MSAGVPTSTRFSGMRLVVNPTNLASAYPYGGTEIGLVRELEEIEVTQDTTITAEEFGGVAVETTVAVGTLVVACNLRGWDKDAISLLPFAVSKGSGARYSITTDANGTTRAGVASTYHSLLMVPDDRTNGIARILYRVGVHKDWTARTQRSYGREFGLPIIFVATLDQYGRRDDEGLIGDLTLGAPA